MKEGIYRENFVLMPPVIHLVSVSLDLLTSLIKSSMTRQRCFGGMVAEERGVTHFFQPEGRSADLHHCGAIAVKSHTLVRQLVHASL